MFVQISQSVFKATSSILRSGQARPIRKFGPIRISNNSCVQLDKIILSNDKTLKAVFRKGFLSKRKVEHYNINVLL